MKRFIKPMSVLSMVLLLSLTLVGAASADVIRGQGWIHAEGSGWAKVQMNGEVEISGHGVGAVYIYGADEITAEGEGRRTNLAGGGVVFRGYEGKIYATGERMLIKMVGSKIDFTARGQGRVVLRGQGHYETEGFDGGWTSTGVTVDVPEE